MLIILLLLQNLEKAISYHLIKKRDFWMPFTPSIIDGCYDDYIINPKKIDSSYYDGNFRYHGTGKVSPESGITPYDYTARPQKVTKEICPTYYHLIREYKEISGIGALLNTSLNIHGKPIVVQPTDLLNEILKESILLKFILIDKNFYMRK